MTTKLYWEQPYSKDFTAKTVGSDGTRVELDETLFYPRGGGVSCDTGVLGGMKVVETSKDGDKILHILESPARFAVGQTVTGRIDWDRRHRLMRMHTAGHLLSALFYSGAKCLITGNQIDVDRSRMDFSLEVFDRSQIEGFVREIPDMVKLAEVAPPVEAQLRIVEIAGIDRQADGGLHVAHLNEIGRIELLKLENKGKTNRRLYYDVVNT